MMSLSDDETSAGHWVQERRGVFMLVERKDEKLHFLAEMGMQTPGFARFNIFAWFHFRGWHDCRVAKCFVFALPLRK